MFNGRIYDRVDLKKLTEHHSFCLTSVTEKNMMATLTCDLKEIKKRSQEPDSMLVLLIYHSNASARPLPNLRAKTTPLWLLSLTVVNFPYSE